MSSGATAGHSCNGIRRTGGIMSLPEVASRAEWRAARQELLVKEKAATRARDALNAERRRLPMVAVDREYVFEGGDGKVTLAGLFEGRRQLVVYHFMFAPEWDAGCRSCSGFLDQIGHLAHLRARGTTFAAVSRAPYTKILPFKARMGWTLPWYSSYLSEFNADFEVTVADEGELTERPGLSCFLRDGDRVFHTYSTYERGLDGLGSTTSLLDLTALGRQEEWEEPRGRASALGAPAGSDRVRYHDEYDD
ncbi:CalU12 protein [Streptomyces griseoflavus Tu4000]|uniref:CalU12 protein n=2 Tax=Streptomyces TaxID=1883 RepID=D9XQ54_9ACTN|nr:CalU12 protein [Streptomyces griseoflavus Tu4000]